jgi:hypothetical protein
MKVLKEEVTMLSIFSVAKKNVQVGFGFGSEYENQINRSTVPGP